MQSTGAGPTTRGGPPIARGGRPLAPALACVIGCALAASGAQALQIAGTVGSAQEKAVAGATVKVWPAGARRVGS